MQSVTTAVTYIYNFLTAMFADVHRGFGLMRTGERVTFYQNDLCERFYG